MKAGGIEGVTWDTLDAEECVSDWCGVTCGTCFADRDAYLVSGGEQETEWKARLHGLG